MAPAGKILLQSFGFKYGHPNTNMYIDVTFLPNPARLPGKNLFSELDEEMIQFVLNYPETRDLIDKTVDLVKFLSLKDDIRVGIGCNSGRHRSVIVVNEMEKLLGGFGLTCAILHRDL